MYGEWKLLQVEARRGFFACITPETKKKPTCNTPAYNAAKYMGRRSFCLYRRGKRETSHLTSLIETTCGSLGVKDSARSGSFSSSSAADV